MFQKWNEKKTFSFLWLTSNKKIPLQCDAYNSSVYYVLNEYASSALLNVRWRYTKRRIMLSLNIKINRMQNDCGERTFRYYFSRLNNIDFMRFPWTWHVLVNSQKNTEYRTQMYNKENMWNYSERVFECEHHQIQVVRYIVVPSVGTSTKRANEDVRIGSSKQCTFRTVSAWLSFSNTCACHNHHVNITNKTQTSMR